MRAVLIPAVLSLLTCIALPPTAAAQDMVRGEAVIELGRNFGTGGNFKRAEMSLGTELGFGAGVQMDLGIGKYEQITSTSPSGSLHLYYAVDEDLAVGVFATAEDRRPGSSYYAGIEAAYATGDIALEGHFAYRDDLDVATDGVRYGLDAGFHPDAWRGFGLSAGAVAETGMTTGRKNFGYVGAEFMFRNGVRTGLMVGRTDNHDTVASAAVSFEFGQGARFGRRDSRGLFPAY
ncbi:hypothetical protein ACRARG_00705 [Pseudooceanicola sp. C21-150M6]|uniref:hypothetical protein n=1 Tax=Pseudooceanicola sp. C21-150M6 TaxID=3434355 RepID=UPI003D7FDB05